MEFLKKVKSGLKCKVCGEDHPAALHFHHENPKEKEANISDALARGWSVKRIEGEIKKCSVLCARCHAIWHWEQKHGPWV